MNTVCNYLIISGLKACPETEPLVSGCIIILKKNQNHLHRETTQRQTENHDWLYCLFSIEVRGHLGFCVLPQHDMLHPSPIMSSNQFQMKPGTEIACLLKFIELSVLLLTSLSCGSSQAGHKAGPSSLKYCLTDKTYTAGAGYLKHCWDKISVSPAKKWLHVTVSPRVTVSSSCSPTCPWTQVLRR